QGLEQHLKHLESSAFDATPSRLRNLERVAESFDKAALEDLHNERPPFEVIEKPKIVFTISLLEDGSAFKYMIPFVKKLKESTTYHPAIVTNFETFLSTMKDTFDIQNANMVAEMQLYHLEHKGSTIDYTTKF
ncbi:hypothetical protein FBU30_002566, partial [Linnemannia zychae]